MNTALNNLLRLRETDADNIYLGMADAVTEQTAEVKLRERVAAEH
jgi:hypothetical protein